MGGHRHPKIFLFQIGQAKFSGRLAHDGGDGGVVDMTNLWKQMVLNLKMQAATTPGGKPASGKIAAGLQLKFRPLIGQGEIVVGRIGVLRTLHTMPGLKNQGEEKAGDRVHDQKATNRQHPGHFQNKNGNHQKKEIVEAFGNKQTYPYAFGRPARNPRNRLFLKKVFVVFGENPNQGDKAV